MWRAGVAHLWPTRSFDEMSRLSREEFRATWMPYPPDPPEIFPSFALIWAPGSHNLRNCLGGALYHLVPPWAASRPLAFVKISSNYQPAARARPDSSAV